MGLGHDRLQKRLRARKEAQLYRSLGSTVQGIDFASNDYLGLAANEVFQERVFDTISKQKSALLGSSGSRLLTGNSKYIESLEYKISQLHQVDSALLMGSGYLANLCLFSCIPQRGDVVIIDEHIHRSVHDGCQLSHARKWKFKHNDLNDLERLLSQADVNCYVAVESVYSMDGSFAPLVELVALCQKYQAYLIVDEAHAFGIFGWGLVSLYHLQQQVFATVVTYGKAMGCHGAAILGSQLLRQTIINFGSPFIYSTSASLAQWIAIEHGYDFLAEQHELPNLLDQNIRFFRQLLLLESDALVSPIQAFYYPGNANVRDKASQLVEQGMSVYPILSPTVTVGQERLRICIHTFNTKRQISELVSLLNKE